MSLLPYNAPPALAREPLTAGFWVVCAPLLIPNIGVVILLLVWPGLRAIVEDPSPEQAAVALVWAAYSMIHLIYFAMVSLWSEHVGAGAFAGPMRASQNWILAAILLGPPILLLPNFVMNAIMGGAEGWEYSVDVNTALVSPENWGIAYLALVLLLSPVLEEVTFRGIGMGALLGRGVPPVMTAVLSSAAFTLPHLQYTVPALAVVFTAGLGFAWLRLKSGTMIVPILAHMSANGVQVFLASLSTPPAG